MYRIKVIWRGGPKWNPDESSFINAGKKKTAIEHLILTGGITIDDAVEAFDYFNKFSLNIRQEQSTDPKINWITIIDIATTDKEKDLLIKDELLEYYAESQLSLEGNKIGYSMEVILEDLISFDVLDS
jgi:hypothetical protein